MEKTNSSTRFGKPVSAQLEILKRMVSQPKAILGVVILTLFIMMAIFAPILTKYDPSDYVDLPNQPPSREFILGTTGQGQDLFTQLVYGSRISLLIGFSVGFLSTLIGLIAGMLAGYLPGVVDSVLNLFTNVFLLIPGLPLLIALASFLPQGMTTIILVLTFTGWAWPARVFRSQTLSLREKDFVSAAVVSGESVGKIVFSEILPNMLSLVVSSLFGAIIYSIGADAGLAFLGFENVNIVSWGTMLYWASNSSALLQEAWWTFLPPGLCIALVSFGTTMLIYAMDEVTNPRLRSEKEITRVLNKYHIGSKRSTPVIKEPLF
ncbi:MAG TPA: peptide ABC transporter permease [Anaerolineaceae bacterium]|nr:peptide ABC transporter permease [Anaerolineaceae bacterium]